MRKDRLKISLNILIFWFVIGIISYFYFGNILVPTILFFFNIFALSSQWSNEDSQKFEHIKYRLGKGDVAYCEKCLRKIENLKYLDCKCGGLIEVSDNTQYLLKKRVKNIDEIVIVK